MAETVRRTFEEELRVISPSFQEREEAGGFGFAVVRTFFQTCLTCCSAALLTRACSFLESMLENADLSNGRCKVAMPHLLLTTSVTSVLCMGDP